MSEHISHTAMTFMRDLDAAARELEFFDRHNGEWTSLHIGDRVWLVTPDGNLPGNVVRHWAPKVWPSEELRVALDCSPNHWVQFHRTLFQRFSVLDQIAES